MAPGGVLERGSDSGCALASREVIINGRLHGKNEEDWFCPSLCEARPFLATKIGGFN